MQECDSQKAAFLLFEKLKAGSLTLALCESCTAGLVSSLIGSIAGASEVLFGSFVCYTLDAKVSMLGLDRDKLKKDGLVSKETALLMAQAALEKSGASLAASITGLAGPGGDGSDVPVGTVWVACAAKGGQVTVKDYHFTGSRDTIRTKGAIAVLEQLLISTAYCCGC